MTTSNTLIPGDQSFHRSPWQQFIWRLKVIFTKRRVVSVNRRPLGTPCETVHGDTIRIDFYGPDALPYGHVIARNWLGWIVIKEAVFSD